MSPACWGPPGRWLSQLCHQCCLAPPWPTAGRRPKRQGVVLAVGPSARPLRPTAAGRCTPLLACRLAAAAVGQRSDTGTGRHPATPAGAWRLRCRPSAACEMRRRCCHAAVAARRAACGCHLRLPPPQLTPLWQPHQHPAERFGQVIQQCPAEMLPLTHVIVVAGLLLTAAAAMWPRLVICPQAADVWQWAA